MKKISYSKKTKVPIVSNFFQISIFLESNANSPLNSFL